MARKGGKDRGLIKRVTAANKEVWYVRASIHGQMRQFGSFRTKTEAWHYYQKIKAEARAGRFYPEQAQARAPLVADVVDAYLETAIEKKAYRDERRYAAWWKAYYTGKRLPAITPGSLEQARRTLLQSGRLEKRSAATANRYLAWLKHVLELACRHGRLASNPVKRLQALREPRAPELQVSASAERQIIDALGEQGLWVRFAILTGLRQTEQFRLRREQIDWDQGCLLLRETKAGEPQVVYLSTEAQEILRELVRRHDSLWVFPSPRNPALPIRATSWYSHTFRPLVRRLGLQGVTWHTLRHTFGSRLAAAGINPLVIQELGRWKTASMVQRYAHFYPHHLRAGVESLSTRTAEKLQRNCRSPNGGLGLMAEI